MANKERNKRSARKARQKERAEREAQIAASAPTDAKLARKQEKEAERAKTPVKAKAEKPGLVGRIRSYLFDVRGELHRVTWPNKGELRDYSVAVVAMLIFFGVAVWLVDTGFVALLVGLTGLRG